MSRVKIVADVYDAFARGDIPTVLAAMDPEIQWYEAEGNPYMPTGEAFVGSEAVLNNLFVKLGEDWEGFAVHPGLFHDAGDVVVVEGRYTAQHKKTGRSLNAQLCHVWTLRDGKVAKFQQYVDTAQLRGAMGVGAG